MKYNRIPPRIWANGIRDLSEDGRSLFFYLHTCEHRTTEGLFRLPKPYMCADLQWLPKRLGKPFGELLANGYILYDEDNEIILLAKALEWQQPSNDNQVTAILNHLDELPETPLLKDFQRLAKRFSKRLAERLDQWLQERLGKPPALAPALTLAPGEEPPKNESPSLAAKEEKEKETPTKAPACFAEDSVPYQLALQLRNNIHEANPRQRVPDPNPKALSGWAVTIDRMIRLDGENGLDPDEVGAVISWLPTAPDNGDFCWSRVILSADNLCRHYARLWADMQKKPKRKRATALSADDPAWQVALEEYGGAK